MTPAEKSLAAVRALSEGRAPKRYLNCIPVQSLVIPPAPQPVVPVMSGGASAEYRPLPGSGRTLAEMTAKFQATNPGDFSSQDLADFAGNVTVQTVTTYLLKHPTIADRLTIGNARQSSNWRFL